MNCNYIRLSGDTVSLWRSGEMEYNAKVFSEWGFSESLTAIISAEIEYDRLGLPYNGITQVDWTPVNDSIVGGPWNTIAYSVSGELNWKPIEILKLVVGGRCDNHTYTDRQLSPRATLLILPNSKNVIKLIFARSIRLTSATELRMDYRTGTQQSGVEELISYELSAAHTLNKGFNLAGNVFYHDWEPIGFNSVKDYRTVAGEIRSWGFDLEGNYKFEKLRLRASHSYTKLLEFDKHEGAGTLYHYSTADNGVGNDFTYWHNHNTKLSCFYSPGKKLALNGSMNILWGSPGGYNCCTNSNRFNIQSGECP